MKIVDLENPKEKKKKKERKKEKKSVVEIGGDGETNSCTSGSGWWDIARSLKFELWKEALKMRHELWISCLWYRIKFYFWFCFFIFFVQCLLSIMAYTISHVTWP